MATNYVVTLDLKTIGSLDLGLGGGGSSRHFDDFRKTASQSLQQMRRGWNELADVGSKFMGVADRAAEAAFNVAKYGAIAGGAAAFGLAWQSVHKLNSELETTTISLGAIFNANGASRNFASGMELASDQIKKMRVDARELPGELEDLQRIYVTGAGPAMSAGLSADRWREVAAKTMAAAAVYKVPQPVAAREMAMLLEGRAGAHNFFGLRLSGGEWSGEGAKKFNQLSQEDRAKEIESHLDKVAPSIEGFKKSQEALESSVVDRFKQFSLDAGGPLTERWKATLTWINNWFDDNQALVSSWASYIGERAATTFDWARTKIEEWWPPVRSFFSNLFDELGRLKDEWGPTFSAIGEFTKKALADPETIKTIETLIKGYAGLKATEFGLGRIGDAVSLAAGTAQIASAMKNLGWIKGAADIAGGAGAAAGGAGVMAKLGALMANPAVLAGGAAAGLAGGLYYGAFNGVPDKQQIADKDRARGDEMARATIGKWERAGLTIDEQRERLAAETNYLRANFQDTAANSLELAFAMKDAATAASLLGQMLNSAQRFGMQSDGMAGDPSGWAANSDNIASANRDYMFMPIVDTMTLLKNDSAARTKDAKKGHGGTSVQKVEIVVTSNQHPSRIARSVVDEIVKLDKNVRVSRHSPPIFR